MMAVSLLNGNGFYSPRKKYCLCLRFFCFLVCCAVSLFFLLLSLVSSRHVLPVQCSPHVLSPLALSWGAGAARPAVGHLTRCFADGCCYCCYDAVVLPVAGGAVGSIVVVAAAVLVAAAVCCRLHFGAPSQVAVGGGRQGFPHVSAGVPPV